ncbi:zinc finger BED domain-containing protein RICESLEEPER 2 isoform X3 [Sorghum bicolor]|uniref:zinc finger BED domain-containing protein RICESLEEPER 2 isoform X3 n=1 Tax=Sorghum bicolor TaxID=4558 RepID=UPI000B4241E6|nr:zinc finger BED domain-containing protein RICESLEEPER 2 isoform X3 [Sorghum bicolor]|eukprot:XP_021305671.1 zinc finger BED domain-containing protein RICESLEEPER 2 isoform X3 [Sorghum bicolor]
MHLEPLAEVEDHNEDFDMNAEISVSVPTNDDRVTKEVGDDVSVPSSPSKATRGRKGKRSGVHLSPSKVKVKCRFCHKSYAYQQGGATSQLNHHLSRCTQFQNKLAKAKRILAQDSEWDMYEKIRPILGEMAGATTAFSGSVYPTANVFYPYILKVKLALLKAKNEEDPYLKNMGAAMLDKFNKYWEEKNNVMVIATILDPRFKMRYIEFYFRKLYGSSRCEQEVADIKKELEELYKKHELEQRRKMGGSSSSSTTQSASSSKETTSSVACLVSSEFESFLEPSASETSKSELLIYLDEANHPLQDKNFNLLHYWKVNALRFPIVSSLAKKFLVVPASSVSSESTFSCGGRVLDDYRSSLKPATVQALVCASSWIRGSKSPHIILGEDADDGDIESVELSSSVVKSN